MNAFFPRGTRRLLRAVGCLFVLFSPAVATLRAAAGQPVTIKELCLMLRGGYTGDEVLRETTGRPLLDPLDAEAEKSLRAAGADARLIAALQQSHRPLTDSEAAAARQRQANIDHRNLNAREAGQARLLDADKQAAENSRVASQQAALGTMARGLRGQLQVYRDGHMQPYDETALAKKQLFAFYFSTGGVAQCRDFTAHLIQFYRDFGPKHPPFEIVFYSLGPSAAYLEKEMRLGAMPWPALAFESIKLQPDLAAFTHDGVPRLTLIDGAGRLVSDSYVDGKYLGPQHVLDELTRLAAASQGDNPAAAAPAASPTPPPSDPHAVDALLHGKLVTFDNGSFKPANLSVLENKKVIAIYLTTFVSAASRKFFPDLIQFYRRVRAAHPEFEIVTVSSDRSVFDMENMMRREQIPWPSLAFDQLPQLPQLQRFEDHSGSARLLVVENTGRLLQSYNISLANDKIERTLPEMEKIIADPVHSNSVFPGSILQTSQ